MLATRVFDAQMNWCLVRGSNIAEKMKFSITDFFNKCDQIRSFLRIW